MDLTRKKHFSYGCSGFKLNNLELAVGMALKVYTSMAKVLKIKVRMFLGLISSYSYELQVTRVKMVVGTFLITLNSPAQF